MTLALLGQILGLSFACGLNLYLAVAALGILSRTGIIDGIPPGLHGLEGLIVIGSAALLYIVETVVDKIRHADSLWDTVHTFIRPPAAALLAVGALWGHPLSMVLAGAGIAFFVAFAAHGTKAGVRIALNTARRGGHVWISLAEDALAVSFAALAFLDPRTSLIATTTVLLVILLVGPRYWRAFHLGFRALLAWLRAFVRPAGWRAGTEIPRSVRAILEPTPLGAAPPRATPAALLGLPGTAAYRNGWLVTTVHGPVFVYRTLFGMRQAPLPLTRSLRVEPGIWADVVHVEADDDRSYRLYMLKDGPAAGLAIPDLNHPAP